jgi:hypothetical protein
MSADRVPTLPCPRMTARPPFDLAEFARLATSPEPLDGMEDNVFEARPNLSWTGLDAFAVEMLRLLDGVMPVALLESFTWASREEICTTLATLLARGFIVERSADLHFIVDAADGDAVALSTRDFLEIAEAA